MQKIKSAVKGHRHHGNEDRHHGHVVEDQPVAQVVPGSVPVTGTYSKTEAEYQAAMGNAGGVRATETTTSTGSGTTIGTGGISSAAGAITGEVVAERPVAVGVAEVPVKVTEQTRVVGTTHEHHEHHHAHHHAGTASGTGGIAKQVEQVCGQMTFTQIEDRPVIRERVERIVEHRAVEKQYVVETRFVGEQEMDVAGAEIVDIKDRVVDVAAPGPTCPVNTGAIMSEVVEGISHTTGTAGRV